MTTLRISQCLQLSILQLDFDDVRATATCRFWLLDLIEMAFKTLEGMNGQLRQEMERRQLHSNPVLNAIQRVSYSDYAGELFLQCYKGKAWIHSIGKLVDASEE
ncbi:hypothetical protein AAEP93_004308 [Penicillium crustosum]